MKTSYETDIVAWAKEQAALIRAGHINELGLALQFRKRLQHRRGAVMP